MKKLILAVFVVSFCIFNLKAEQNFNQNNSNVISTQENITKIPVTQFETMCDEGDAKACITVYEMQKDPFIAFKFAQKACEFKELKGCNYMAVSYYLGRGVKQDYKKSFEIYKDSCAKGNLNACQSIGIMYRDGRGVKQDVKRAIEILSSLCHSEQILACEPLATVYSSDEYGLKDVSKAFDYFDMACAGSISKTACKRAFNEKFVIQACEDKNARACLIAGHFASKKRDIDAIKFYQKSCEYKFEKGCIRLKELIESLNLIANYKY
ncbi:tetratricopeptide repeat protein [Campylobacter sp.]|uniref:tetratricopeptide repeat protein n=1 Tax=Campylobacter sp. TaxID=205 RepID=UPI00270A04D0|nr:tetratricopeptide repeat protein [Campylobacter sp.]